MEGKFENYCLIKKLLFSFLPSIGHLILASKSEALFERIREFSRLILQIYKALMFCLIWLKITDFLLKKQTEEKCVSNTSYLFLTQLTRCDGAT